MYYDLPLLEQPTLKLVFLFRSKFLISVYSNLHMVLYDSHFEKWENFENCFPTNSML